jgi:transglutaminase-like putative cysteine protease
MDEHADFLEPTDYTPHISAVRDLTARAERDCDGTSAGFALTAMGLVHNTFRHEKGATHVQSSSHDTLVTGAGVCQDFAHILLAMMRSRGLPARYVSGYLVLSQTAEPGAALEQVSGAKRRIAWDEVFIPSAGCIGLDPTSGSPASLQHVRVAYGRDYGDVAPVRGVYKGERDSTSASMPWFVRQWTTMAASI